MQVTRNQKELFLFSFYSGQVEGIRIRTSPECGLRPAQGAHTVLPGGDPSGATPPRQPSRPTTCPDTFPVHSSGISSFRLSALG